MRKTLALTLTLALLAIGLAQVPTAYSAEEYRNVIASEMNGVAIECPNSVIARDDTFDGFVLETSCFTYNGTQQLAKIEAEIVEMTWDTFTWDGPWERTDQGTVMWRYITTSDGDLFALALYARDTLETLVIIDLFVFDE